MDELLEHLLNRTLIFDRGRVEGAHFNWIRWCDWADELLWAALSCCWAAQWKSERSDHTKGTGVIEIATDNNDRHDRFERLRVRGCQHMLWTRDFVYLITPCTTTRYIENGDCCCLSDRNIRAGDSR